MTFADRVVVMNDGRIEQIGRPRAKRERSPNQSVALVVPRGGVPWASNINAVRWQTAARGSFDPQRLSGAVSNHHPVPPIFTVPYKTSRAGMSIQVIERKPNGQFGTGSRAAGAEGTQSVEHSAGIASLSDEELNGPLGWPMKARHGPPAWDRDPGEPSRARRQ